ncbi:hypothetical protein KIS1582_0440 [Cytobacillus firmus]|uniref:Uncharacterized protein n=1 Tax=Cytobacillus firmus TaxID=1399 RepID=A0A800NFR2_CYTFI|nr:hypothetical protein KIS1582_0440 [Cytobacillus firmus]
MNRFLINRDTENKFQSLKNYRGKDTENEFALLVNYKAFKKVL